MEREIRTIRDIKPGMLLKLKDFGKIEYAMVVERYDGKIGVSGEKFWCYLNDFNEYFEFHNKNVEIIEIYSQAFNNRNLIRMDSTDRELIWSREKDLVDWSKIKVDTLIYVSDFKDSGYKPRYFAEYKNGEIFAWANGATSLTSEGAKIKWKHAKLMK